MDVNFPENCFWHGQRESLWSVSGQENIFQWLINMFQHCVRHVFTGYMLREVVREREIVCESERELARERMYVRVRGS